jgi:hypothetical protein
MSLDRAAGHPNYSSDGTNKFIPEIWSGKLIEKFYAATVFGAIANTDYEGEIKAMGDKVIIRTRADITVKPYVKGMELEFENLESPSKELLIDKAWYFAFALDDVDMHQSDLALMNEWSDDASEQMKQKVDQDILGSIYADANAYNKGATAGKISGSFNMGETTAPVAITKGNILDSIIDAGTILDEQNIPETSRFLVIPAWMAGLIKKSDLKDASLSGDGTSIMRNGRLGIIDRFTLYTSNNLSPVLDSGFNCYNTLFGHISALTFASQINKVKKVEPSKSFTEGVKGLQVYGYEVLKDESLGVLYARKG